MSLCCSLFVSNKSLCDLLWTSAVWQGGGACVEGGATSFSILATGGRGVEPPGPAAAKMETDVSGASNPFSVEGNSETLDPDLDDADSCDVPDPGPLRERQGEAAGPAAPRAATARGLGRTVTAPPAGPQARPPRSRSLRFSPGAHGGKTRAPAPAPAGCGCACGQASAALWKRCDWPKASFLAWLSPSGPLA